MFQQGGKVCVERKMDVSSREIRTGVVRFGQMVFAHLVEGHRGQWENVGLDQDANLWVLISRAEEALKLQGRLRASQ